MRRSDREVTDNGDLIDIIRRCEVCRLAISDEPVPYILPLNFGMEIVGEDTVLYFHGANEGKKYELIRKNNRVAFEMDCSHKLVSSPETGSCTMEYESVIGEGFLQFVGDGEKEHAMNVLMKQYHMEDFPINMNVMVRTCVMKLMIHSMTGKIRMKYQDK
jgi:uncharacterized protein